MDSYDLKKENNELKKMNELLRSILDSVDDAVYAVDNNDKIILYNSRTEEIEKIKRSEVLGMDEKDVYFNDSFNEKSAKVVRATGKPVLQNVVKLCTFRNTEFTTVFSSFPFYYEGELAAVYTINHDINSVGSNIESFLNRHQKLVALDRTLNSNPSRFLRYVFDDLITQSSLMRNVIRQAKKVALHDSAVMIVGETGTGKEMFAQSIHMGSKYFKGPFIPVNCAAVPESLMESILFGTVKGAFTGAVDMPGLFEQASGGTLFLDEINSMPLGLQSKLLRVLQEKKIRRIGNNKESAVDCRIISSANRKLKMEGGEFRPDLFFRLAVVTLNLPPLRKRQADILLLSEYFIKKMNQKFNAGVNGLSEELKELFVRHKWLGNVRELENTIESAMNFVSSHDTILEFNHLPEFYQERLLSNQAETKAMPKEFENEQKKTLKERLRDYEKKLLVQTLQRNNGNITKSAEELGIIRQNLQIKLKNHGIDKALAP
jgi:arginine utilization regulatory protein